LAWAAKQRGELSSLSVSVLPRVSDVGEDFGAQRGAGGGGVGAKLRELGAEMLVETLGAGVEARELAGQVGGEELREARVFNRGAAAGAAVVAQISTIRAASVTSWRAMRAGIISTFLRLEDSIPAGLRWSNVRCA
jgi:hypothetical protein